eukprot:2500514-Pyramimonas_sp.AAC.1
MCFCSGRIAEGNVTLLRRVFAHARGIRLRRVFPARAPVRQTAASPATASAPPSAWRRLEHRRPSNVPPL